jgi:thiol:disulfide interchange protein DsbA
MKHFVRVLVAVAAVLGSAAVYAFSLERYAEGVHYTRVANGAPQPGSVVEFFSFGCPHCAHLEPALEKWLASKPAKVEFSRIPATWNPRFAYLAQVYFAVEALGLKGDAMQAVFDHIHKHKKPLDNEQDAQTLFAGLGVDADRFKAVWNTPEMKNKMNGAQEMMMRFQVRGVPAFIVGGQYMTSVTMAGSEAELFEVIAFLLAK